MARNGASHPVADPSNPIDGSGALARMLSESVQAGTVPHADQFLQTVHEGRRTDGHPEDEQPDIERPPWGRMNGIGLLLRGCLLLSVSLVLGISGVRRFVPSNRCRLFGGLGRSGYGHRTGHRDRGRHLRFGRKLVYDRLRHAHSPE